MVNNPHFLSQCIANGINMKSMSDIRIWRAFVVELVWICPTHGTPRIDNANAMTIHYEINSLDIMCYRSNSDILWAVASDPKDLITNMYYPEDAFLYCIVL